MGMSPPMQTGDNAGATADFRKVLGSVRAWAIA
jgi:hypothetical protein